MEKPAVVLITGRINSYDAWLAANAFLGANSGVGFAACRVLACSSEQFHVIMACRSSEKANTAKEEIDKCHPKGTLSTIQLDVTDEDSIKDAATRVQQQFGRLDVLVNNAGVGGQEPNVKTRYQKCLTTNVLGPAMVSEAFRPLLLKSKKPYSIFVGSGQRTLVRNATQKPPTHGSIRHVDAYQVSKAALNMLAVVEHRDYGPQGLKVFVLSPGFVRSNLRGTSEEERSGWGGAGDAEVPGQVILDIIEGLRDADAGCLVHADGIYPW